MNDPRTCETCRFFSPWNFPPLHGEGICHAWPTTVRASNGDAAQRFLHVFRDDYCDTHDPDEENES
jgi:hypothetical protein